MFSIVIQPTVSNVNIGSRGLTVNVISTYLRLEELAIYVNIPLCISVLLGFPLISFTVVCSGIPHTSATMITVKLTTLKTQTEPDNPATMRTFCAHQIEKIDLSHQIVKGCKHRHIGYTHRHGYPTASDLLLLAVHLILTAS